ncbi:hypothetical protein F5Y19DRAFT_408963 [Xylariaceae sp. FL1651]|nr:hypothetical protein F5Y19DRAFT_408963 [Xylariaceae sp. FL1651]
MAAIDRGTELAAVTAVFLGLASVAVFLRCYVRLFVLKLFRVEDWLAISTLASSVAYTVFVLMSIEYGAGKHTNAVPIENIPKVLEMRWAGEITYVVTSMFLKFTIGIFLLRICSRRWHKVTIWMVLAGCLVFNLFYVFVAAFQCHPVAYFWQRYTNPTMTGSCLSKGLISSSTYAAAAVNASADWALGLLPIALVWNLDLGKRQKISVAGILAVGSVASTATIVRIFYVWQLTQDDDILYSFTDLAIWSTVENGLGLTASSIATLRPLFKSFLDVATQHRLSSPWPALKRTSENLKFHCRGPSADVGDGYFRLGPYPPQRTATVGSHRRSDGSEYDSSAPSPSKYSWQSFDSYESHRDVLAGYYHPVSPRVVRSGWHSDGTRYHRKKAHSYGYQQPRNQRYRYGPGAIGRQSV